jgi:hypothetical protein
MPLLSSVQIRKAEDAATATSPWVSARGTDLCVCCGADTGWPTHTPVASRQHYVEGSGQNCVGCARMEGYR